MLCMGRKWEKTRSWSDRSPTAYASFVPCSKPQHLRGLARRWLPGRCPGVRHALPEGGIGGLELVRGGTDLERRGVNPGVGGAPRGCFAFAFAFAIATGREGLIGGTVLLGWRALRGVACEQGSAAFPQEGTQRFDGGRQLRTVRADQMQWRRLAIVLRKDLDQSSGLQVVDEIQSRLIDQAFASDRPTAHRIGIVADAISCDGHGALAAGWGKAPAFMDLLAPDIPKAVVAPQVIDFGRCAMLLDVRRCRAQRTPVVVEQFDGQKRRIRQRPIAHGQIQRLADEIGRPVAQLQVQ